MNLEQAKELFKENHPEETKFMLDSKSEWQGAAQCVWLGFKSALILTCQLEGKIPKFHTS